MNRFNSPHFRFRMVAPLAIGFVAIGLGILVGCENTKQPHSSPNPSESPKRIISMAPSITETLFALGLGDQVVGVSRFCTYPPEVKTKPKVGGLFDPNLEAILSLRPDRIILLKGEGNASESLKRLDIPCVKVDHRSIDGILDSFDQLGQLGGVTRRAAELRGEIESRLEKVRRRTADRPVRSVLVCISRDLGAGRLESVYLAGDSPFFNSVLKAAGGVNPLADSTVAFPVVSLEGIMKIDPEVILDLTSWDQGKGKPTGETLVQDWNQIEGLRAVKTGNVFSITDDYATIPGPRFILLVEAIADILDPTKEEANSPNKRKTPSRQPPDSQGRIVE